MVFDSHVCDQRAPLELSVTTMIVTAILCLITVPGNILICWVVVKDPNKELRYSQFNCLVLNLAIADLITGLITEPLFVAFHIKEFQGKQAMDNFAIIHVAYFISCTSSLLSISSLATERYLSVTSKYRRIYSQSKMVTWSVVIWISSIAVSFVYFAVGFYKFVFVFSNIIVIATFCAIIYAYIGIYQSLHAQGHVTAENDRFMDRRIRYEKRATRSFLLVLIVFICCNLSSCAMVYVILLCDVCSCYVIHWLRDFQFLTALVNCAANQFLYAWRMPSFVRAFKRSFHRTVVSTRSGENPSDLLMCAYARNSSLETHTSQTRTLTLNLNG